MDIRVINSEKEIINVSKLSITTMGEWLVGIDEKQNTVRIERFESKEVAKERLEAFGKGLIEENGKNVGSIIIVI